MGKRAQRQQEADVADSVDAVAGERSELLARKHGGQRLSPGEQARLEVLTARLKELLPPVSLGELEALLEMAEETERIRERAWERRRRVGLSQQPPSSR
jgi:hypothetical protein